MNEPLIEFNSPLVCWRAMHPMQFHKPQTLCNPSLISAVYATQMKICQGWWFVLTSYRSHQHNVRLQLGGLSARRRGKKRREGDCKMRRAMHSWWGKRKEGNTERKIQCFAFSLHWLHGQMRNKSIWLCGGGCVC